MDAARANRRAPTAAEAVLWERLRRGQVAGHHFRRQHAVGGFILDFYCPDRRLAIEVDGSVHESPEQAQRDAERTAALSTLGIEVLRFTNDDVMNHMPDVLAVISTSLTEDKAPSPATAGEGVGGGGSSSGEGP